MLRSWQEFMQIFDDCDIDFQDAIENPEQLKRALKKIKQDNQDFGDGSEIVNPFGFDIETVVNKSISELMGELL